MKLLDLYREASGLWRDTGIEDDPVFYNSFLDDNLTAFLPDDTTHATLLAVPTADVESVVELLRPYAELPDGYRLATADDKRGAKPDGTLYWLRWRWFDASSLEWNPENLCAVPVLPEPPAGYRLATDADKRGPKPDGTMYWSAVQHGWELVDCSHHWLQHNLYAVPDLPEPPAGYRLATGDDRLGEMPGSALVRKEGCWQYPQVSEWQGSQLYAVPVTPPAHAQLLAQLHAEILALEAELGASRQRLDELKGGLEA